MRLCIDYAKRYTPLVLFCLITKTLASFAELAIPEILAIIIDDAVPTGDMGRVWALGGLMLGFALLTFLLNVISNRFSARASGRLARDIREDLFKKTLALSAADCDRIGTSSLTSRLTSDTYNVSSFFGRLIRMGVRAPIMTVGGVILTLFIDWRLSLVLIGVLPLIFLVVYKITVKSIPIYKDEQRILDTVVTKVDETAKGIRVVKALSKEEYEREQFHKRSNALAEREIEAGSLMAATKPLTDLILNGGFCLVVLLGYLLSMHYGISMSGKLLAFMTYFTIILNSMIMMTRTFVQLSRMTASSMRIKEILDIDTSSDTSPPEQAQASSADDDGGAYIEFDNVTFSYNKTNPDISDITFKLSKGQTLGIIGATGSGKSTLISLLLGLYAPDSGKILVDGESITEMSPEKRRSLFGVAHQHDFIPEGDIRGTVGFMRDIGDEDILHAIRMARAEELVLQKEGGLSSPVNTGGTNLSGGQKQRLLIARAIAGGNPIVILDDSSSALDFKTDSEVRAGLLSLEGATKVIVSQRISSVMSADLILVLKEGRVIGRGTHSELLSSCEEYSDIARVQLGL
ncbi:MAG: ABC transporter ATP-binding protein [Clostridia bacterium]|nr:ABC transporter ATP-binding protein [Clostridia bacterium]